MIDWPNAIAGAFLGMSPVLVMYSLKALMWIKSPIRNKYKGNFYIYHWSFLELQTIRQRRLMIHSKWWRPGPKVSMSVDPKTKLSYNGKFSRGESSTVYLNLEGQNHRSSSLIVLNDPFDPRFRVTTGVLSGADALGKPVATRIVLSREILDAGQVRDILKSRQIIRSEPYL